MVRPRFRRTWILAALALLLLAASCASQQYPAKHRYGRPKGCDCPKF